MSKHPPQYLDEVERQAQKHGFDGWLWLVHFGEKRILPDDEGATCQNCSDYRMGFCTRPSGHPFECMKAEVF